MVEETTSPGRWRRIGLAGLVALLLGLAIGFVGTNLVHRASLPADDSAAAGFARDMSSHHAQAVAMGMIAADRATSPAVRSLGADIALTQQSQIGMMRQWLRDWGLNVNTAAKPMAWMPDANGGVEGNLMPGMATPEEMTALDKATGRDVDRLFLQMMIKHHLGGVHMVDGVLAATDQPDVVWLAGSMKAGQQGEIAAMQQLQQVLGFS
ncbi:DUF305 domain-containing protein [Catellatospora sp. TT07R-123]|uniref:DUF305 domain-containing protein n=1 Tax=Catellatospora sp. TT07R-123 TaxID=2733863 RepID=UPI001B0DE5D2|nr:DUF305 domain-containing protein [Catellatospora sp. TT07R-123]GHJ50047.1 DUF305 domain-containing protein [Catellatospora sp. TT07R-123]